MKRKEKMKKEIFEILVCVALGFVFSLMVAIYFMK
jgi:hypothetical protein